MPPRSPLLIFGMFFHAYLLLLLAAASVLSVPLLVFIPCSVDNTNLANQISLTQHKYDMPLCNQSDLALWQRKPIGIAGDRKECHAFRGNWADMSPFVIWHEAASSSPCLVAKSGVGLKLFEMCAVPNNNRTPCVHRSSGFGAVLHALRFLPPNKTQHLHYFPHNKSAFNCYLSLVIYKTNNDQSLYFHL